MRKGKTEAESKMAKVVRILKSKMMNRTAKQHGKTRMNSIEYLIISRFELLKLLLHFTRS